MDTQTYNRAELLRLYNEFVQAFGVPDSTAWISIEGRKTMPCPEEILCIVKSKKAATKEAREKKQELLFFLNNYLGIK